MAKKLEEKTDEEETEEIGIPLEGADLMTPKEETVTVKEGMRKPKKTSKVKTIEDLPGVGDKIAEKLKKSGYFDLMSIAAASPKELGEKASVGELTSGKLIKKARD